MEIKAILCVVGAILINLTLGTFYSVGNIIPYIASYMRNNGNPNISTEHGTWLTSSFLLGQGLFILVGAYIERKFNSRIACIFGCLIHCSSTFLTIWAINESLFALIIVYGLGSGLGCGSAYVSSIIAAQKWFPQSKGFFTGLIVAGFGCGGLVFTPLQTLYMNPDNIPSDSSGYFEKSIYARVPNLFLYMGIIFTITQTIGCLLVFPSKQIDKIKSEAATNNSKVTVMSNDLIPNMVSISSAFKYRIFYLIALMMMLVAPGVTFVNSLGKKYGQAYNDDRFLATVLALAAVTNALGRLTWGFLMDKYSFSTCYTVKVILFATLVTLFPFKFILSSKALYLIWMLGLFFGFSGTFVLFPVFAEQVFGEKSHGIIYGIFYICLAVASNVTAFVIQVTITPALAKTPESNQDIPMIRVLPCIIIAMLYILSLLLYIFCIPVRKLERAIKNRLEQDANGEKSSLLNRKDLYPLERPSLAEKTSSGSNLEKENSLGSIVRFRDTPEKGINTLHKS